MFYGCRRGATITRCVGKLRAVVNCAVRGVTTPLFGLRSLSLGFQRLFQCNDSRNQRRWLAPVRVGSSVGRFYVEDHIAKLAGAELAHLA
jgi:hypothetical protein